ncbi:MAG: sensor histidine kinase, partial [Runella sp.]
SILEHGPMGLTWLCPEALFGMKGFDNISHGLLWSLLVNVAFYIYGSLFYAQSAQEKNQARLFVDIFKLTQSSERTVAWRGKVLLKDIQNLLSNFFGTARANRLLNLFAKRNNLNMSIAYADPSLVNYTEKLLGGAVGTASARILVASVAKEERISTDEVIDILKTSQQLKVLNRELQKKTYELERVGEQLLQTNKRLEEADRLKDDFLSTVTHELRTPLTSIRALSEIVHDNPDMSLEERQHFIKTVIKDTDRLSRLINQVLDLERFDAGRQQLHFEIFSPRELIIEAINSIQQLANEKKIAIIHTPQHYLPEITADRDRIMQVLVNLLSNAIKYTPPHKGMVALDTYAEGGFIYFRVSDNGTGIDPLYHELIFDKFYQAQNQTIRKPKGSGLGLAICRRIVEHHGGKIWVISKAGDGASFTFKIPINQSNNQTANAP